MNQQIRACFYWHLFCYTVSDTKHLDETYILCVRKKYSVSPNHINRAGIIRTIWI